MQKKNPPQHTTHSPTSSAEPSVSSNSANTRRHEIPASRREQPAAHGSSKAERTLGPTPIAHDPYREEPPPLDPNPEDEDGNVDEASLTATVTSVSKPTAAHRAVAGEDRNYPEPKKEAHHLNKKEHIDVSAPQMPLVLGEPSGESTISSSAIQVNPLNKEKEKSKYDIDLSLSEKSILAVQSATAKVSTWMYIWGEETLALFTINNDTCRSLEPIGEIVNK